MLILVINTKEKKRQFIIHELIQTETQYVRTLLIMKKIYHDGMKRKLDISNDHVATIFPVLEEMLNLNRKFLRDLKTEQKAMKLQLNQWWERFTMLLGESVGI